MATLECNAIIFDMDGTLIDTNECIENVWRIWGERYNIEIKEILHGRTAMESIEVLAPHLATEKSVVELEGMVLDEIDNVKLIPGAKEFIAKLPENSWTIATSASKELATANLNHVGIPVPETMITAEKVSNGKPHPEPFLKAAELLNTTCDKCIVFEDSLSGLKAGYESGATVIGLTTTHSKDELKLAKHTIDDFRNIKLSIKEGISDKKIIVSF